MKAIFAALLFGIASASAQDVFFNQWFTNWTVDASNPNSIVYRCTNTVEVSSNQIFCPWTSVAEWASLQIRAEYEEGSIRVFNDSQNYQPALGPCTIRAVVTTSNTNQPVVALWRIMTVNTTASAGAMAIQPRGMAATVGVQTSTNLVHWTPLESWQYGPTNASARFFRLWQSIP